MARMRTLKPDAASSESLCQVPREVRWTFGMLWTYLDDEGRGLRNCRLIKAAIYPLDDDMTPDAIARELLALQGIGAVCFYEVDGKELVHVPSWHEHQHPNRKVPSKLPECPKDDHSPTTHAQRSESAVSAPRGLTSVVVVGDVDGGGDGGGANARGATALAAIPDTPTAQSIVAEWIEHCTKRPPSPVIGQVAKAIGAMLAEGVDPDDVRRGVGAWHQKGLHPSTLPSVVNEVMNARPRRPRQQQETDDMFDRAARRMGVLQ